MYSILLGVGTGTDFVYYVVLEPDVREDPNFPLAQANEELMKQSLSTAESILKEKGYVQDNSWQTGANDRTWEKRFTRSI